MEKENNFNNMKNAFENSQKAIEFKNIEESKKNFEIYIANEFLKEFEIEGEKMNKLKISLTSSMQNFAQEFINLCNKFINNFKSNTYKIIIEFDIKENNKIEHINFIVIGKTGVGKSTFINESLLLPENKRAKEGIGEPVTHESFLYSSDKLKMLRMWDTQGLDYNNTLETILNEIKRLVKDGIDKGPDNFINIILYCTQGQRFENGDGQLINEIMKLYPFDNLPVVIVQLQSDRKKRAKKMEEAIRNILIKYLEPKIVEKIEIKSILSRDSVDDDILIKAYGIPELLRLSFDIMGRSISSATCLKISEDIKKLCKDFMNKKILYVQNLFKYEMEILEVAKNLFEKDLEDEDEDDDNDNNQEEKELSEFNIYRNIENPNYFVDNFIKVINDKFINIFNYLENGDMPLDQKENENENNHPDNNLEEQNEGEDNLEEHKEGEDNLEEHKEEENNLEEHKEEENNLEEHKEEENNIIDEININENINQENNQNEKNDNVEDMNEENEEEEEENSQENEIQNGNEENENKIKQNPELASLIKKRFKKVKKILDENSDKSFKKLFEERFDIYFKELLDEQSEKNREYKDNTQLINKHEIEKNFKEKLLPFFKNEFFKIFFCIILKLFMNNLKDSLDMIVKKELDENENLINEKAENSLKNITETLKNNLISELDNLMNEQKEKNN